MLILVCAGWLSPANADEDLILSLNEKSEMVVSPQSVWGLFEGSNPYLAEDPGFEAATSGGVPGNTAIRFNVEEKLFYSLGGPTVPAGAGIELRISRGSQFVNITGSSGKKPGLQVGQTSATGSLHAHVDFELTTTAAEAAPGLYGTMLSAQAGQGDASEPVLVAWGLTGPGFESIDEIQKALGSLQAYAFPIAGDITRDGQVNIQDFVVLRRNFGNRVTEREQGDLDNNQLVDISDFVELRREFGKSSPFLVPEPGSLLSCGMIGLLLTAGFWSRRD